MDIGSSGLAGLRVFIVEDEAMLSLMLQDWLEELGCRTVERASRIGDAVEKAMTVECDVAVLDVNLNGEFSGPVAGALAARGVPFVVSTGYGREALPQELGRAPRLSKPFDLEHLQAALLSALHPA